MCGSKENNEHPKAEFESDELSLNFHEYKHAPIKTS